MFRDRTFQIWRRMPISGQDIRRDMQDTENKVSGILTQLDPEFIMANPGEYSKSYQFNSPEYKADIKEGDELRGDGEVYKVKGVQRWTKGMRRLSANLEYTMEWSEES